VGVARRKVSAVGDAMAVKFGGAVTWERLSGC